MKRILYSALLLTLGSLVLSSCLKEYDNPAEGVINVLTPLYEVRDLHRGSDVALNTESLRGASKTRGVVISDGAGMNMEAGTFIIQYTHPTPSQLGDLTSGLAISLSGGAAASYLPGDELEIDLVGARLTRIDGRLTIADVAPGNITKLSDNQSVEIKDVTLGMLMDNFLKYENTLVRVHADVSDYSPTTQFSGERMLDDHISTLTLHTLGTASFASNAVPVNAQFTGIPTYYNASADDTTGAKRTLRMRTAGDVAFESGPLYETFPESFEFPDFTVKGSYNMTAIANNVDLLTGNWKLQQAILGNTIIRDKSNLPGKQCVRMQQNLSSSGLVQMNFDVTEGASKVTLFYGKYYTDPRSTFRLEYSVNGGTTWVIASPNVSDMPDAGSKQASFMVDVDGPVRFRVNKLGLGTSSSTIQNGRLCIEDVAIYKKL